MSPDRIAGCLLGTAAGDALGLPYEGLSRRRAARLFGPPDRHRFCFGRGMVSDDTEHTCLAAHALLLAPGNAAEFQRTLARGLRYWLLGLPAGVGLATLRATLRLWLGFSPENSGVFSAGNGPAMRAAVLGVVLGNPEELCEFVRCSTRLTHTDPLAEQGALAVALAAQLSDEPPERLAEAFRLRWQTWLGPQAQRLGQLLAAAADSAAQGEETTAFADSLGLARGVTGYILHTVPIVVQAWLRHPDNYRAAITAVIRCGGDTDTTAAIVGGLVGARVGRDGIPPEWLAGLWEWSGTIARWEHMARSLAQLPTAGVAAPLPRVSPWGLLGRNLLFLSVVLFHGFRRLAPPY